MKSHWLGLGLLIWQTVAADTLRIYSDNPLAATVSAWVEYFHNANATLEVGNTLTTVQALLNHQAEVVAISRTLTSAEARILQTHNPPPLAVPVGLDALGIVVHPQELRQSISLAELEYQFAGTQRCHRSLSPIPWFSGALYAPTPANASHFHFQTKVLCGGRLGQEVVLLEDDAEVIAKVAQQPGALGFASKSSVNAKVRLLPLSGTTPFKILPTAEHLTDGRYPLTYYWYLYLDAANPLALAFARTALSAPGQAILAQRFVPLPEPIRQKALARLESGRD